MTRRSCLRASTIASAALSVALVPVLADEAAPTGNKIEKVTVTAKRSTYRQSMSSTATKTDTALRDVPQSVTVISKDLIKDQDMRSMMDVVRYVPGVSMGQGEGHRDAPTLRGNSSTADFFVDGVRDDVQYYRDLYNAERIEILKGPNAMIFGRGGGGGVINRVTERADWTDRREVTVQGGSYNGWRGAVDFGGGLSESAAVRLNAFYEDSDSYRDYVNVERFGINPTATVTLSPETEFRIGYEYFDDHRTVDRGVPSRNGRPLDIGESAFFGNPDQSYADTAVHFVHATLEHAFSPDLKLRNHTVYADYDKYYQNVHANSAVDAVGKIDLQAYNSGMLRQNAFNQTDLIWDTLTGPVKHKVLVGLEFGWQDTDNTRARNNDIIDALSVTNPTTFAPVAILGSPLQADNFVEVGLAAVYLQDQIELSEQFQIVAGARFDSFELDFDDRRAANADFSRADDLVSPRVGAIYKPIEPVSLYTSYAVSYLPQSGDQFASLDINTVKLEPEEFENIEVGLKWDINPGLTLTAALYQLDRTNTRANGPNNTVVQTGEQRSEGFELGLAGAITDAWSVMAGYALQDAEITERTSAAPAGRKVPLVPEQTFALWNHYQFAKDFAAGLGVTHQTDMFASISNAVVLPAFTRVDAGVYYTVNETFELQVNVENLFDETYWSTAHNDNNITPGSPRAVRVTLTSRF